MTSFQEDAAKKTGKSRSTVERKTRIGSKLRDVAESLRGTAVEDSQKDLLALAKMAEKETADTVSFASDAAKKVGKATKDCTVQSFVADTAKRGKTSQ